MSDLERLFYWRGVASDFNNFRGQRTEVPIENRVNILKAMGVDLSSETSISEAAFEHDVEPWFHWLPNVHVITLGESHAIECNFRPSELSQEFTLSIDGNVLSSSLTPGILEEVGDYLYDGARYSRRSVPLNDLELGYHVVEISTPLRSESCALIVCPSSAYQPSCIANTQDMWGLVVQLYTLCSKSNWGYGDFSDLRELIELSAAQGAAHILLNPFHALPHDLEHEVSPYSPSDRRFLNPLYIDVTEVTEYAQVTLSGAECIELDALRKLELIDYTSIRSLKYAVLWRCFRIYIFSRSLETINALSDYIKTCGTSLIGYAEYEGCRNWRCATNDTSLDLACREALSKLSTARDMKSDPSHVLFYCYLQYIAESQLEACQRKAIEVGMKLGLIRDLAVGASGGGSEVSSNPELFCRDVSIGAPPDPMALKGQNWGMPPMDPAKLKGAGFQHYIDLLRSNMKHCGALRIDHAMSLMRLWWCPPKLSADNGTYIYYPLKELLGILCLESHINQCAVIGEDLGVVPDEFRAAICDSGIISNKVFYFEKHSDFEFKKPNDYAKHALAMLSNHDVPTLQSWWSGTDLELREKLNLLEENIRFEDLVAYRLQEKIAVIELLREESLLPDSWQDAHLDDVMTQSLRFAVMQLSARSNSKLYILQLEDLIGMDAPVNVPGTYNEYPNWRRRLSETSSDIFNSSAVAGLLHSINQYRSHS
ncbi:MAG: 4-alpha-glucanotransferase [Flavobacteriales bacterium]|jgi:4-alpha-glucanotransferase